MFCSVFDLGQWCLSKWLLPCKINMQPQNHCFLYEGHFLSFLFRFPSLYEGCPKAETYFNWTMHLLSEKEYQIIAIDYSFPVLFGIAWVSQPWPKNYYSRTGGLSLPSLLSHVGRVRQTTPRCPFPCRTVGEHSDLRRTSLVRAKLRAVFRKVPTTVRAQRRRRAWLKAAMPATPLVLVLFCSH